MRDTRDPCGSPCRRTCRKLLGLVALVAVLAASLGAVESLSQRRRRVEAMSAEQLDGLLRAEQQFHALSPQDQQRIRDLHDQIESDPDRDRLLATMNRYSKWLNSQSLLRRDKLDRQMTLDERVKTVRDFIAKPEGPGKEILLDAKSRQFLVTWLDRYTTEHGNRFTEGKEGPRPGSPSLSPDRQKRVLRVTALGRWKQSGPKGPMPIADPEMARLRAGLSPEVRTKLEAKTPVEQARIIAEWLQETATGELDEELADFFVSSAIDDDERDRLMSLSSDEMFKSLSDQYSEHLRQSTPAKPGDRPSKKRGRGPGAGPDSGPGPRGPDAPRSPENRDRKGPRGGKDFNKGNPEPAGTDAAAERPPLEKSGPDRPVGESAAK